MGQANTKYSDEDKDCVIQTVVEEPDLFHDGEMREVVVEGNKLLIIKDNGKFFALGAHCPVESPGEPLFDGVLHNGHIRCAKHGAVFDVATGDLLEHPGLDSVHSFHLEDVDGHVTVRANRDQLKEDRRVKRSARLFPSDKRTILIIGAGPAGSTCAETLRQEGFIGKIVLTTSEKCLPYDRTQLSKVSSLAHDGMFGLRDRKFYSVRDILVKTDKEVVRINTAQNKVSFKDGDEISFHKLLIATGCKAKMPLMIPGHDLQNIVTLRSINDLQMIQMKSTRQDVVIVGASFTGLELASSLVEKVKSITMIETTEDPLEHSLGHEIGKLFKKVLEHQGVRFHMKATIKAFEGTLGRLEWLTLSDGTKLQASLCITAVGVEPVVEFLKDSGLVISSRNYLVVDKRMKTNKENVFGAGDVTEFPLFLNNDVATNIQHWQMAQQQGRIAALNMLDKVTDIQSVPFYWVTVGEHTIRFTGYNAGYDRTVIKGSFDEASLVVYYIKCDHVVAVASYNSDATTAQAAEMLLANELIDISDIQSDSPDWMSKFKVKSLMKEKVEEEKSSTYL